MGSPLCVAVVVLLLATGCQSVPKPSASLWLRAKVREPRPFDGELARFVETRKGLGKAPDGRNFLVWEGVFDTGKGRLFVPVWRHNAMVLAISLGSVSGATAPDTSPHIGCSGFVYSVRPGSGPPFPLAGVQVQAEGDTVTRPGEVTGFHFEGQVTADRWRDETRQWGRPAAEVATWPGFYAGILEIGTWWKRNELTTETASQILRDWGLRLDTSGALALWLRRLLFRPSFQE